MFLGLLHTRQANRVRNAQDTRPLSYRRDERGVYWREDGAMWYHTQWIFPSAGRIN